MDHPIVIVTGASRGLGAAAAHAAAQYGAHVVLVARSGDALQNEAQKISQMGSRVLPIAGDVSQEEDCRRIIQDTLDQFGRIDALINNAGIIEPIARISDSDLDLWQRNWAINFLGPLRLIQLTLPSLRQSKGRVINISSGTSTAVIQGWGAYSTAKAAIDHLTRILAQEETEITSLTFRPGIVDTAMQETIRETGKASMTEGDYGRMAGLHQSGRLLPVEVPGKAMACLSIYAPHEWSGETLQWNDPRVQELVQSV